MTGIDAHVENLEIVRYELESAGRSLKRARVAATGMDKLMEREIDKLIKRTGELGHVADAALGLIALCGKVQP